MQTNSEPRPRKHPQLWQAYLMWEELMKLRQRHNLRISAIERGVSNMDAQFERDYLEQMSCDTVLDNMKKAMIAYGKRLPVWEWTQEIKGLKSGGEAAKLLALIDDIEKFDSIAKLWRHAGYGLYEYWVDAKGKPQAPIDGYQWEGKGDDRKRVYVVCDPKEGWTKKRMRDTLTSGWCSPYNKTLKSLVYMISTQFVRQRTLGYRDLYDAEKLRLEQMYPKMSKGHRDNRAMRKMSKEFLKHLWINWRIAEDLPITDPWAS